MSELVEQAREAIQTALAANPGPACYTCSFQLEDVALLDLLREVRPDIPVLFLETGYHFAATYEYRDRLAREWNLNLQNLMPRQTVAEQEAERGKLYQTEPTACCDARKVEPLFTALENYEVWFTGLRREQSPTRAKLQVAEKAKLRSGRMIDKVSPLALWTWKEVWAYAKQRQLPVLSLYDQGYTSIGCEPCTALPVSEEDLRSGRWGGKKLECGIHTQG
ncbi:MAG: phosphoadenylyl-sulfate reductase [Bryobacter sp.]|nr:phosphoadenylyl-sulfate reductase [Bryobacter sp.]